MFIFAHRKNPPTTKPENLFTLCLSAHGWNFVESVFTWIILLMVPPCQKFAHITTAVLSLCAQLVSWSDKQQTHDVIMTSLLRQNYVATSFWCNNDIIASAHVIVIGRHDWFEIGKQSPLFSWSLSKTYAFDLSNIVIRDSNIFC